MADGALIRRLIRDKTGYSERHINRLVTAKSTSDLLSRDHASMAVAVENNVNINRAVDDADWASLRGSHPGGATSMPAASPSSARPARAARAASSSATRTPRVKPGRTVMVVYGRDGDAKNAMFEFLESLDLKPMSWTQGISQTKIANPSVREVVDALFAKAVAVVVLLTPDDEARLKPEYHKKNDPAYEKELTGQARPNVLFEAGMAMSSHPERTVLTQIGSVRPFTDIGGIHITHLNNSIETRRELAAKLSNAKCQIDMDSDKWRDAGNFEPDDEE
ncbi:TIR domain-containing protein [Microbacterium sp. NPDC090007]|uniref:TIR domain-containing protein n=1 Tax=Microbacterium sp. NPDC090007 TaxID=3364204 RepID=UPI0037F10958